MFSSVAVKGGADPAGGTLASFGDVPFSGTGLYQQADQDAGA